MRKLLRNAEVKTILGNAYGQVLDFYETSVVDWMERERREIMKDESVLVERIMEDKRGAGVGDRDENAASSAVKRQPTFAEKMARLRSGQGVVGGAARVVYPGPLGMEEAVF